MITQKKIAEALGLSTSTVANILNGTPNYKKETREKVLKAVEDFGYRPNRASRAIKRGRSNLIGVIHSGTTYEVGQKSVYGLLEAITKSEYDYLVVDIHWHGGDSHRVLDEMVQARVEGVVLCADTSVVFNKESLAILRRAGIPVVSLYGDNHLGVPVIGDAAVPSFYALTRHLQDVGHQSILMPVCPPMEERHRSVEGRKLGFYKAVEPWGEFLELSEEEFTRSWPRLYREYRGRRVGIVVHLDWEKVGREVIRATYVLARNLLASGAIPDAMMATNDRAAYGIFSAAHELGIRIPENLAVTGADDDLLSSFPLFRLTSIRQDVERSCAAAIEMLRARIAARRAREGGVWDDAPEEYYPSQIVLRQSCGRMVGVGEPAEVCIPTQGV